MQRRQLDRELTDGVVLIRRPAAGDLQALIAGRDNEFHRFIGPGSPDPKPTAVVVDRQKHVVGWIDYDVDCDWLDDGEVNVGYNVFPDYRGNGIAQRSLELLLIFLAEDDRIATATLLIDPENTPSVAVAKSARFHRHRDVGDQLFFKRPVRPSEAPAHDGLTQRPA